MPDKTAHFLQRWSSLATLIIALAATLTFAASLAWRNIDRQASADDAYAEAREAALIARIEGSERTLHAKLSGITKLLEEQRDNINMRFDGIDKRFDDIDTRPDGIDTRLDGVDERLDGIDVRLEEQGTTLSGHLEAHRSGVSGVSAIPSLGRFGRT